MHKIKMLMVYMILIIKLFLALPLMMVVKGESLFTTSSTNTGGQSCSINSLYTWQCNNGQCIQFEELCDGIAHCTDKSDETVEQCLHKPCPAYAFKCAYGGCITGDYKCNGIIDCVDGSDETRFLCDKSLNYTVELRGKCWLTSSMECKSGECISSESACDGVRDCSDGSDETVELCSFLECPEFSFRCGYGACVAGSAKCNNIYECADGSDESPGLCGYEENYYPAGVTQDEPKDIVRTTTQVPSTVEPIYVHPYSTPRPSYNYSTLYPYPTRAPSRPQTSFTRPPRPHTTPRATTRTSAVPRPTYPTTSRTTAVPTAPALPTYLPPISTPPPIWPSFPKTSTLPSRPGPQGSADAPGPPPPIYPVASYPPGPPGPPAQYCKSNTLARGISTTASCFHNNLQVSCYHTLRIGTKAEISCAPGYTRERSPKLDYSTLMCDKDGEWTASKFQCFPICGTLNDVQKRNTIKPWDVTIMRRTYEPIFHPLCSGVIVSPKVIVTAANCLLSIEEGYATDHIFYNIVEGVYNYSYIEGDSISASVHNVSRIAIKTSSSSHDLAILVLVNYFHFTDSLKPICLPSIHNNLALLSDDLLNVGRGVTRDTSREYLEYIIAKLERTSYGRKATNIEYIRVNYFVPFILREIQRYRYIL